MHARQKMTSCSHIFALCSPAINVKPVFTNSLSIWVHILGTALRYGIRITCTIRMAFVDIHTVKWTTHVICLYGRKAIRLAMTHDKTVTVCRPVCWTMCNTVRASYQYKWAKMTIPGLYMITIFI